MGRLYSKGNRDGRDRLRDPSWNASHRTPTLPPPAHALSVAVTSALPLHSSTRLRECTGLLHSVFRRNVFATSSELSLSEGTSRKGKRGGGGGGGEEAREEWVNVETMLGSLLTRRMFRLHQGGSEQQPVPCSPFLVCVSGRHLARMLMSAGTPHLFRHQLATELSLLRILI